MLFSFNIAKSEIRSRLHRIAIVIYCHSYFTKMYLIVTLGFCNSTGNSSSNNTDSCPAAASKRFPPDNRATKGTALPFPASLPHARGQYLGAGPFGKGFVLIFLL